MRILFIAWDGPFVNYLDGLFLPIFTGLKRYGFEFHVLHFTWAPAEKVVAVGNACSKDGIPYWHVKIRTKPVTFIGKYLTLLTAHRHALDFIRQNNIEVLMPRTMMPAMITIRVLKSMPHLKVIFDADGLPIEERVDFAGLKEGSFRHRQFKKIEKNIIWKASLILCRSRKAIDFLVKQYPDVKRSKFRIVVNGRNEAIYQKSNDTEITHTRMELGIPMNGFVIVYSGSLGPQYGVMPMLDIHQYILSKNDNAWLLILTPDPEYMSQYLLADLRHVIVRKVPHQQVTRYLSVAQAALALRKPTTSMQGVSPIKLGEYLLIGLPVIASAGIGDTEEILSKKSFCYLLHDFKKESLQKAGNWVLNESIKADPGEVRKCGMDFYGLQKGIESYHQALTEFGNQTSDKPVS